MLNIFFFRSSLESLNENVKKSAFFTFTFTELMLSEYTRKLISNIYFAIISLPIGASLP